MRVHRVTRKMLAARHKVWTAHTPKSIEVLLRETARKSYPDPENVNNPMIAPQDYDVRQSGRVLELQNRDLWIRHSCDLPRDALQKFPRKVTREVGSQRRSQEAEDSEE